MIIRVSPWKVWGVAWIAVIFVVGTYYYAALDEAKVVKRVPTAQKVVALTVDDGPNVKSTPALLQVLREKNVHITMFILGRNAEKHPELLAQAAADGHEIASHAYSHTFLNKMSREAFEGELDKTEKIITAVTKKPVLLRPPGGGYNDSLVVAAQKRGYTFVLWSVDALDWKRPSVNTVVNNVMNNVKPGSIVLMHDGQDDLPTAQAMGIIIDRLRSQGYKIVTVSELLQYSEPENNLAKLKILGL